MTSQNDSQPETPEFESFENELCIHCAQPNAPLVKFCRHCRAPIHPLAAWCPYEKVHATGFIWRAAAGKPRNKTVIIGIYIYFLPTFFFSAIMLRGMFQNDFYHYYNYYELAIILTPLFVHTLISLLIIIRTTANFLKRQDGTPL